MSKENVMIDSIMKVVALGDSIIKGVLFNKEANGSGHYSLSDHNIVDRVAEGLHCEVLNLGKMGCTIETGERILEHHSARLDGARYVLLCYGGNDSDYDWKAIADRPEVEHQPKTSLRIFEKTYMRVINKVRKMGYTPLVMSLPPMDAQQYFDFFTSSFNKIQRANVLKWLKGSVNTIWAGHELYNDAVKRVANATNCVLIDCTTTLGDGKGYLCEDGIHPNVAGQSKIASIILRNT
jgi:lysophospholipase L1-like esterase